MASSHVVKLSVVRATGQGEQSAAEVNLPLDEKALDKLHLVYRLFDDRCYNRNKSLLSAMKFMEKLPVEARMGVKEAMDILYGASEFSEAIETLNKHLDKEESN
jgi:hypothetical protein